MKYYIDNFRGFNDQMIDLNNITFLVGENSSGKTSLINAINILSDFRFWLQGEINPEICGYTTFDDFLSAKNTRNYFTFGLIDDQKEKMVHLVSFNDDNGLPHLFREIFYKENCLLVIESINDKMRYKLSKNIIFNKWQNTAKEILDHTESKAFKKVGFKKTKTGNGLPLSYYKQMINHEDKEVKQFFPENSSVSNFFYRHVSSLAPIRAKPQPFYSGVKQIFKSEGDHIPYLLKEAIIKKTSSAIVDALIKYGKESGLYDNITISLYGKKKNSPFELNVEKNGYAYKINSVGYGVSQILPIVSELLVNESAQIINIQQPEVHLHPKAQAAFGSFLFDVSVKYKERKFIIETHSDYIIDRFRYNLSIANDKPKAEIFYLENDGESNIIHKIQIDDEGKYIGDNIDLYRTFFFDESFKVMRI